MKRCAVRLQCGRSRSSHARPSVRLLTAALEALYAALPLLGTCQRDIFPVVVKRWAHGGLVMPCFEPVLTIIDWFSW